MSTHRVVVLGGGFGGLRVVRDLRRAPVEVVLVDRRNFHLFQPLLYQVATGGLSPANIAATLRNIFKNQRNVRVILDEAVGVDLEGRSLILRSGSLRYDTLVVAAGSGTAYFGNPRWERLAPGLKSVEDALEIRKRIFTAFEAAEKERDPKKVEAWLTFVVVGGGPTGVELAGALAEISRDTLKHEFRVIDPSRARVVLVEGDGRVLPGYPDSLSAKARRSLEDLGVEVMTGARVEGLAAEWVEVRAGGSLLRIGSKTVLWAAGVRAVPLAAELARAAGLEVDGQGRVPVERDCTLPGHPEVFAIGDMVRFEGAEGALPGVAPVAIQQGAFAAKTIRNRLRGRCRSSPFRYRNLGSMATIGRSKAVAYLGRLRLSGYPAWLAWLFIHLMNLVEFQDRLLVFFQWAWSYVTFNRDARLITCEHRMPWSAIVPSEPADNRGPGPGDTPASAA